MTHKLQLVAFAAMLLSAFTAVDAAQQPKAGKNFTSEEAAKWLAQVGERFYLDVYGNGGRIVLTTDKKANAGQTTAKFFLITPEEAKALVQALVDCGLWTRPDTLPHLQIGRYLSVGSVGGQDTKTWRLGYQEDDVTSMVIVQRLLTTTKGDAQKALKDWLGQSQSGEKK